MDEYPFSGFYRVAVVLELGVGGFEFLRLVVARGVGL
jgi:hypothetical protein